MIGVRSLDGDLIIGAGGASAFGTLLEWTTRLVVLVRMPMRKADVAASAVAGALNSIPSQLRKSLTYEQGKNIAKCRRLAEDYDKNILAVPILPRSARLTIISNDLLNQFFFEGYFPI